MVVECGGQRGVEVCRLARPRIGAGVEDPSANVQPRNSAPLTSSERSASPRSVRSSECRCQPFVDVAPAAIRRSNSSTESTSITGPRVCFTPANLPIPAIFGHEAARRSSVMRQVG
jgi:hypothetical protein